MPRKRGLSLLNNGVTQMDERVMSPWAPDACPKQARRIGKTMEEIAELMAVIARINIQGMDAIDPASGKTNRQRLAEESADVSAQLHCNALAFKLDDEFVFERMCKKITEMHQWEKHFER